MTREDYIKKAYEDDKTLDPGSIAKGWSLKEQSLREQSVINFETTKVKKWQNRDTKKILKVMPWYQPIADDSRMDFNGLLKDLMPEVDLGVAIGDAHIYSGLVMQNGYMIENHNRCWFGIFMSKEEAMKIYDDLGDWDHEKDEYDVLFKSDKEVK
jgi:hypothetical protein